MHGAKDQSAAWRTGGTFTSTVDSAQRMRWSFALFWTLLTFEPAPYRSIDYYDPAQISGFNYVDTCYWLHGFLSAPGRYGYAEDGSPTERPLMVLKLLAGLEAIPHVYASSSECPMLGVFVSVLQLFRFPPAEARKRGEYFVRQAIMTLPATWPWTDPAGAFSPFRAAPTDLTFGVFHLLWHLALRDTAAPPSTWPGPAVRDATARLEGLLAARERHLAQSAAPWPADSAALVAAFEGFDAEAPPTGLLDTALLRALDALDCRPVVRSRALGWAVHVLAQRDWESDYVRAFEEFHCPTSVRGELEPYLLSRGAQPVRMAEVGTYLGSCLFWAAEYARERGLPFTGYSIEPYSPAAAMQARTVAGAQQSAGPGETALNVTVIPRCVGPGRLELRHTGRQPQAYHTESAGGRGQPCADLQELVGEPVDVLRAHVIGGGQGDGEADVLESVLAVPSVRFLALKLDTRMTPEKAWTVCRRVVARGLRLKRYPSCDALRARFQVERQSDFVTLIAVHHPPRARENRTRDNTDQEIASQIGRVLAAA